MRISDWSSACALPISRRVLRCDILECPGGEIGRRRGLKIPRRKACRFDSGPGHQLKIFGSTPLSGDQHSSDAVNHTVRGCAALGSCATRGRTAAVTSDRKSVVKGKSVSVRVDFGGCRLIKKKNKAYKVINF